MISEQSIMFENISDVIAKERLKLDSIKDWSLRFTKILSKINFLDDPWTERSFIHEVESSIPKTTIVAGVDGGLLSESMNGFDLIIYRGIGTVFHGIGSQVEASYFPNISPEPRLFFSQSLPSRFDFQRLSNMLRLIAEYETATQTILKFNPSILFLDGKVSPMQSDILDANSSISLISQTETDLKNTYIELLKVAKENNTLLCGVIKDSRSRELVKILQKRIPEWIFSKKIKSVNVKGWRLGLSDVLDHYVAEFLLTPHQRTAWLKTDYPYWVPEKILTEIRSCYVKTILDDFPIRLEIAIPDMTTEISQLIDLSVKVLNILCQHGLPVSIPSIIIEADDRVKLNSDHLEMVIDQISMNLGIPKEQLRKRRNYRFNFNY